MGILVTLGSPDIVAFQVTVVSQDTLGTQESLVIQGTAVSLGTPGIAGIVLHLGIRDLVEHLL